VFNFLLGCQKVTGRTGVIALSLFLFYSLTKISVTIIRYAAVDVDAGYYLPVVERLQEGSLLYRDIANFHPPFVFYLMNLLTVATGQTEYGFYLSVAWGCVILCGVLVFAIVHRETEKLTLSILAAILVPIVAIQYEGFFFFLEPFVALFALLSFVLAMRDNKNLMVSFLSGFIAAIAFMCKLYGLGILPAVCLLRWMCDRSRRYQNVAAVLVGFIFSAGIIIGYVLVISQMTFVELITMLTPHYRSEWTPTPVDFKISLPISISFLIVGVMLLFDRFFRSNRVNLGLIIAVLGFVPQFYFRWYKHYMLLMVPFIVALWCIELNVLSRQKCDKSATGGILRFSLVILSSVFLIYSYSFSYNVSANLEAARPRLSQLKTAAHISEIVPPKSRVVLLIDPSYYFLCNFLPADDHIAGYFFLDNFPAATIESLITKAEFVILSPSDVLYFGKPVKILNESGVDVFRLVTAHGFKLVEVVKKDIQIWKKLNDRSESS
jgi:hypothetical protein